MRRNKWAGYIYLNNGFPKTGRLVVNDARWETIVNKFFKD